MDILVVAVVFVVLAFLLARGAPGGGG